MSTPSPGDRERTEVFLESEIKEAKKNSGSLNNKLEALQCQLVGLKNIKDQIGYVYATGASHPAAKNMKLDWGLISLENSKSLLTNLQTLNRVSSPLSTS